MGGKVGMRRYSPEEHTQMVRMWSEGASLTKVAESLGRTAGSVAYYMHRNRQDFPLRRVPTTREERTQIIQLRREGWTTPRIAEYLGVSEETVRMYARRAHERQDC